jgi:hypothetical protein
MGSPHLSIASRVRDSYIRWLRLNFVPLPPLSMRRKREIGINTLVEGVQRLLGFLGILAERADGLDYAVAVLLQFRHNDIVPRPLAGLFERRNKGNEQCYRTKNCSDRSCKFRVSGRYCIESS